MATRYEQLPVTTRKYYDVRNSLRVRLRRWKRRITPERTYLDFKHHWRTSRWEVHAPDMTQGGGAYAYHHIYIQRSKSRQYVVFSDIHTVRTHATRDTLVEAKAAADALFWSMFGAEIINMIQVRVDQAAQVPWETEEI